MNELSSDATQARWYLPGRNRTGRRLFSKRSPDRQSTFVADVAKSTGPLPGLDLFLGRNRSWAESDCGGWRAEYRFPSPWKKGTQSWGFWTSPRFLLCETYLSILRIQLSLRYLYKRQVFLRQSPGYGRFVQMRTPTWTTEIDKWESVSAFVRQNTDNNIFW